MGRQRGNTIRPRAAIEVTGSHLHAAVLEPARGALAPRLRTRSVVWRKEATSMLTEVGQRELTSALAQLAAEERLRGAAVLFALDRRSCTTRVITGTGEAVRRELELLEARSGLYLGLGHGPKALASVSYSLDARHEHALLAVANRRTLDALLAAAAEAGLEVEAIEPSAVVVSRVLGHIGRDVQSPQLFATLNPEGVELGISYAGRLLLDYRPGGRPESDVAATVGRHLSRLARYCQRYCRQIAEQPRDLLPFRIQLFGAPAAVAAAQASFQRLGKIEAEAVDLAGLEPSWQLEAGELSSEYGAAVGLCLSVPSGQPRGCPNFLDRIRAERRQPLLPTLLGAVWPVAAAVVIAALLSALNVWERSRCDALARQIEELEPARDRAIRLRQEILSAEAKAGHLERIQAAVAMPPWSDFLATLARCLPENVWLERLEANGRGGAALKGASYGDEGTYQLVRWLNSVPGFGAVQLEGMQPQRLPSGLVTKFDVKFDLAGQANPVKEAGKNE